MANPTEHQFGGDWTEDKLDRLRRYLSAYSTIMTGQAEKRPQWGLKFAFIDAFAGTGHRVQARGRQIEPFLPELAEPETRAFLEGSAEIALRIDPPFSSYIFIEERAERCLELKKLRDKYPEKRGRIEIRKGDANKVIQELCRTNWASRRAVLFLDPYGMQVNWGTVEVIAKTEAIDLWYLFPLGVAVNRLLKKNGEINAPERKKLDSLLGTGAWFEEFYKTNPQAGLFSNDTGLTKKANFDSIAEFFQNRLKTIFAGVAPNPLQLKNSRGNPLFLLCFAAANTKGAPTAVKIASHILGR